MHGQHNQNAPDSYTKNARKRFINLTQADIHYSNINFKSKAHLPSTEVGIQYAALDFHSAGLPEEIQYAALSFHSDNTRRLENNLPIATEIILDPSSALNNANGGSGNNITTGTMCVNNPNTQIQRKKIRLWLISMAVVCVCVLACLIVVILWSTKINISEKGNTKQNGIYKTKNPKAKDQKQVVTTDAKENHTSKLSPYPRHANEECIQHAIDILKNLNYLKSCLIVDANVNFISRQDKMTPLCAAVYWGAGDEIVTFLLNQGAEVDTYCVRRGPALTMAISHKKSSLVNILLDYGANPNITDDEGGNALYSACLVSYDEIIPKLLDFNVHVNTFLPDGRSVVHLCSCCNGLKPKTIVLIKDAA